MQRLLAAWFHYCRCTIASSRTDKSFYSYTK